NRQNAAALGMLRSVATRLQAMPPIKLDRFDDFHLYGASAPAWNQRYQQISCGAMRSSLAEATVGDVHVFRKWMSQRVVQQGCLPIGQLCFAVPIGQTAG